MPRKNHTPPHSLFTPTSGCEAKRRYADEKAAQKAAELQMLMKPRLELSVYLCHQCHSWHLTRQARRHDT